MVRAVERGWSQTSAELPLQIGRIDAGASWRVVCVAESNDAHQWTLLLFGRSDKLPIDSIQHQLGATEHLEALVVIHVAPSQVEEAIASLAMNRRASEFHRSVTSCDDSDIEFPARGHRVAWDEMVWFLPDLNPDADVVERMAVRVTEPPSWKIEAVDHNSHTFSLPPPASRSDCLACTVSLTSRSTGPAPLLAKSGDTSAPHPPRDCGRTASPMC